MELTAWVDVAVGLSIIYLGVSLFVTILNEYVSQALNLRGKQLVKNLNTLICDSDIRQLLAQSPVIAPFFRASARLAPSYVDPKILASVLVGGLAGGSSGATVAQQVSDTLDKLPNSELKTQLQAL